MKTVSPLYSKMAIFCCFAACIGDFVITFLIGFLHKDYNFLSQSQSYLGTANSPVAFYMNAWGVLFSVLFLLFAYALYRTAFAKGRWQHAVVWLIVVYGLGEGLGSGLFPYEHIGNELTLSGKLHSLFSGLGVTALMIVPFALLKAMPRRKFRTLREISRFVGWSGLLLVIIFLFSKEGLIPFRGLWQRLFLLDYYWLLMTIAVKQRLIFYRNEVVSSWPHYTVESKG
jgi:hypothetical protein